MYKNLFVWNDQKIEDVQFWCEPQLTNKAIDEIAGHFDLSHVDGFVGIEARGFYLAGLASSIYSKPTVMVRKHKAFYEKMAHESINFKNWKGDAESLTVLKKTLPSVKNVIIVDDIIDTGASLRASKTLLKYLGINIVGAFYLLNSLDKQTENEIDIPIKSILKQKLFE